MEKIETNANGEIVDSSGAVLGKRGADGKIVFNRGANPAVPQQTNEKPKAGGSIVEQMKRNAQAKMAAAGASSMNPVAVSQVVKQLSYTKYDVKPESEFKIEFCLGEKEGRIVCYTIDTFLKIPDLEKHWATFRIWNYPEELAWKNACNEYNNTLRTFAVNQDKLNEFKVRNLLKDWSFAERDPKYKLYHLNGILADESYNMFKGFFPTIINNILFLMNQVLEYGN